MEFMNGKFEAAAPLRPPPFSRSAAQIHEKISRVLSQWIALQMAVQNEWGGPDSIHKSHQLASDIFSSLFHSKVQVEDLENLLHERLLLTFNTEIEDGSIEEVAEKLMGIGEEYLQGNIVSNLNSTKQSF